MNLLARRSHTDRLRAIPLESVLRFSGANQDLRDKDKWHTTQGVMSVNGSKFINWNTGFGGGGAIDLTMHLNVMNFSSAVQWLAHHFSCPRQTPLEPVVSESSLSLPVPVPVHLAKIQNYLVAERCLPGVLLESLIHSGTLYADSYANAVFLLRGKNKRPVGAELRSTTRYSWRGLAPGSRKDLGCFTLGPHSAKKAILCESAIDAISCAVIHTDDLCISTSGARPKPAWLPELIERGYEIYCGFDADSTGDKMANTMIAMYPTIKRLRPSQHDWNDVITASA